MKLTQVLPIITLVSVSSSAAAMTIQNGSFETNDFSGWQVTDGRVNNALESLIRSTDGDYFAELIADSTLSQQTSWSVDDEISFDWFFRADDGLPYNDFSDFFVLDESGHVIDTITFADVASVGDYTDSGWNTFTYQFNNAGSGTFGIGIYNYTDNYGYSKLYVDNVAIHSAPVTVPATIPSLLFVFVLSLFGINRRCTEYLA